LISGTLSGWTLVLGDAWVRERWPYISVRDHVLGSLGLYAAVGALLGLIVAALIHSERWLHHKLRPSGLWSSLFRAGFYGLAAGLASINTAIWTFSGEQAQKTALATWGPVIFATGLGLAAAIGALAILGALSAIARGRLLGLLAALFPLAFGVLVMRVDLTVYVALYSRVHTILELIAALSFGAGYALIFQFLRVRHAAGPLVSWLGRLAAAWLALAILLAPIRTWFDEALKHVWLEEAYVGRMLRRVQIGEAFLRNPFAWRGMHMARIERLRARYDLTDQSLAPSWNQPLREPPRVRDALNRLRRGQTRYNVIVYYVDTLRSDVAEDTSTMPGLSGFRSRSLDFRRAYAVGSDTLRSLPALTGGNYDVLDTPHNDLLRVARRADYDMALAIAKSAHEFLGKLRPEFRFERNLVIEDYPAEQQVWGYGAQRPTAAKIVDRAIEFIDERRKRPFFLWMFNFDQHNWRELDADYVEGSARKYGIVDDPARPPYRYRAVARAIDHEFHRLITALEARRLLEKTLILFVSDHGEALGRDGFWVHSVFLWESLIRVPLVLYAPGISPREIQRKVSLVDVAPTLGRYLDPLLDDSGYQGEDLLGNALARPPPRRFPLLLIGASKDWLVRVGLVDPVDEYKLVLSFEAALPELYDLRKSDPDAQNFASGQRRRVRDGLKLLLRSPVFPREPGDFDLRDTREQKASAPLVVEAK
jgi:hypothetical protein